MLEEIGDLSVNCASRVDQQTQGCDEKNIISVVGRTQILFWGN